MCKSTTLMLCSIPKASLDPINKCISGQLEELAGVVKLKFIHRSVIYKGGGDLRMYDHGFIDMSICNLIKVDGVPPSTASPSPAAAHEDTSAAANSGVVSELSRVGRSTNFQFMISSITSRRLPSPLQC